MNLFIQTISVTGYAIETVGVIFIVIGAIRATWRVLGQHAEANKEELYRRFRNEIASVMLVGLEFLVAGDIIRTVLVAHSMTDILSLGMIVLIRTVLVFTIHLEVEGRWPWRSAAEKPQAAKATNE
jgi:uncharacterized membrane protein